MPLKDIPLFSGLPEEDLGHLESRSRTRRYARGTRILNMGDESDTIFTLLEGQVRVFRDEHDKEITLGLLDPGDCFGELAALGDMPRSAHVEAMSDVVVSVIAKQDFLDCIESDPALALRIIRLLANRLKSTTDELSSLALLDVYGRLVRFLRMHAKEQAGKQVVDQYSHREIANSIGASREMVSRLIRDLREGGYVSTEGSAITIEKALPRGW